MIGSTDWSPIQSVGRRQSPSLFSDSLLRFLGFMTLQISDYFSVLGILYITVSYPTKEGPMTYKEHSLLDFQREFGTEESCLKAIFRARWPKGFVCPKCGHDSGTRLSKRRAIQCACCHAQTSITAGTIFHKSKVPLVYWFWLIFLMTQDKGGISTMRASKLLGMHYTTVWNMMHKLREAMADRLNGPLLSGYVEIDEAYFGGKDRRKKPARRAGAPGTRSRFA
jgi:Transposase zinc-ribbon domain